MDLNDELNNALFEENESIETKSDSCETWLLLYPGNSGTVPTTLAEPSDSILSSPKQSISELLASETSDVVDEFLPTEGWFGADINDEISNDLYSEVHIDIKPDKETMNSSKNNRKRPVCSQDDLSASDYK